MKYKGPTTQTMPDYVFGGAAEKDWGYDGPLQWTAPTRGPNKGFRGWRPMKKGHPMRIAWMKAGCPEGFFKLVCGELIKTKEPK